MPVEENRGRAASIGERCETGNSCPVNLLGSHRTQTSEHAVMQMGICLFRVDRKQSSAPDFLPYHGFSDRMPVVFWQKKRLLSSSRLKPVDRGKGLPLPFEANTVRFAKKFLCAPKCPKPITCRKTTKFFCFRFSGPCRLVCLLTGVRIYGSFGSGCPVLMRMTPNGEIPDAISP